MTTETKYAQDIRSLWYAKRKIPNDDHHWTVFDGNNQRVASKVSVSDKNVISCAPELLEALEELCEETCKECSGKDTCGEFSPCYVKRHRRLIARAKGGNT